MLAFTIASVLRKVLKEADPLSNATPPHALLDAVAGFTALIQISSACFHDRHLYAR
jgi:hypothetical protein